MRIAFFNIRLSLVFLLAGMCTILNAQTPRPVPATYNISTLKVNYIRTWDVSIPTTDAGAFGISNDPQTARITTNYIDGLGRPLQTVLKKGSFPANGVMADLVSATEYDALGREQFSYLPFAANTAGNNSSVNNGLFKLNPFEQQASFMQSQYGSQSETFFYAETVFENSPLERTSKIMSAGNSWTGSGRGITRKYFNNATVDDVRKWTVNNGTNIGDFATFTPAGAYPAGELYKSMVEDEDGKQVIEFKDKQGKLILKKIQLTATADNGSGANHTGFLCTYYIYDDMERLRCILQPEATKSIDGSWSLSSTLLEEQCFRYEYDEQGRVIVKQAPGAGPVDMVYDQKGRIVMTQDGNMRQQSPKKWTVFVFDGLSRPTARYLWENASSTATHRTAAASSSSYPVLTGTYELLAQTFYDNYDWVSSHSASGFSVNMSTADQAHYLAASSVFPAPQAVVQSNATRGLGTGSMVKVIGQNTYLYSIYYYDDKQRLLQVQKQTLAGKETSTVQYSFTGLPLISIARHEKTGSGALTQVIVNKNNYDDLGRITSTERKVSNSLVNGGAINSYKKTSAVEYDALGQTKRQRLAPDASSNTVQLEKLDYEYNIRGMMLGMNRDFAKSATSTSNYFGYDLGYDKTNIAPSGGSSIGGFAASQYNGNITGIVWKSTGDDEVRKYDFTFDGANRLTSAIFKQYTNSAFNTNAGLNFSLDNLQYDANGNIKNMRQYGWKIGQGDNYVIDNLTYSYSPNSNKLSQVTDAANDYTSKLGDFKYDAATKSSADYTYDANGNRLSDGNKKISSIVYNHMNLPELITVTGQGTIQYLYDAAGNKLKRTTVQTNASVSLNGTSHTTDITSVVVYHGLSVYESKTYSNSALATLNYAERLTHTIYQEGRLRFEPQQGSTAASLQWDYFVKDHLGNVRMVLTEEVKVDALPLLNFEGSSGSTAVTDQDTYWENKNGQSINVVGVRSTVNFGGSQTNAMLVRQSTGTVGATKLLKVMAGDRIHTKVDYFYSTAHASTNNSSGTILTNILGGLVGALTNSGQTGNLIKGNESIIQTQLQGNSSFGSAISPAAVLNPNNPSQSAPKAYLCVLFFNEQFQFDAGSSAVFPVDYLNGSYGQIDKTFSNAIEAKKSGYAYVYFTNESDELVYFDNFFLSHERGKILEETHYYPFGLTIAGISSKAAGKLENRWKFNGATELNTDLDISLYETAFRGYDPQIGRFHEIDQMADFYHDESPYVFSFNNPVLFNDPLGLEGNLPYFNDAWELLNYIQNHGIGEFGQGFTRYIFGDDGQLESFMYDPNPTVGKNKWGEPGVWISFSLSSANGFSEGFANATLGEVVVGMKFIKMDHFLRAWEEYSDYLEENALLADYWGAGIGLMEHVVSAAEMTVYCKLPKFVTKYTGKEGWWLGKNLKFNRTGWGGNGATGGRSVAKGISSKLGVAGKVLGAASVVISGVQAINDFRHGNTKAGVVHTADAVMGVVAMFPPVGTAVSTVYFISRFFWGDDD